MIKTHVKLDNYLITILDHNLILFSEKDYKKQTQTFYPESFISVTYTFFYNNKPYKNIRLHKFHWCEISTISHVLPFS